jgi:hypothetical protein
MSMSREKAALRVLQCLTLTSIDTSAAMKALSYLRESSASDEEVALISRLQAAAMARQRPSPSDLAKLNALVTENG